MPHILTRPQDPSSARRLEHAGLPPLLARLYAARGIQAPEAIEHKLARLLPYARLKGIHEMAGELADAIEAGARLLIIGDYDADGATASAVGVSGLRLLGAEVDFLLPNRAIHGYGLSPAIVEEAMQYAPDALITVDNGIAALAGIEAANALGLPVYVTDHHLPGPQLPNAAGLVNPNQPGCGFPSKHLAGVGVMFYVLAALRAELRSRGAFGDNGDPDLRPLLDLVALGTVADVVRLDDNNRILVAQGLARIRAGLARPGIDALFRVAGCDPRQASASDLGFRIGPRLNAAGRLEDMSLGVRCLLSENPQEAASLAAELQAINDARRDIQSDMQAQADALLGTIDCHMQAALCVFHPDWHAGVVGILASRLKERHHRPVVAFARGDNGELKGSGRSLPALHLRDALDWIDREHPGLILKFGGHAMAAGLSLREADLPRFCAAFEQLAQSRLSPADLAECWETDGELAPGELTPSTAELLENAVWGQGFPPPSFTGEFRVVQQQVVGEKHLRVQLEGDSGRWEAMAFFHADPLPDTVQAHYTPMLNRYQGQTRVQLKLLGWT